MRSYRRRPTAVLALLALPAVALVGCLPTPLARSHRQSVVAPPTTTTISLPPRPRELRLDGIDPCRILGPAQRAQLSLDNPPSRYVDAGMGGAQACTMRGLGSGTVARLALVTTEDVRVWLSDEAQVDARPLTVAGFPALEVRTPGVETACDIDIGVAEGQFLDVLFRDGGNATPLPQDTLCAGARRVAEAAMTGLAGAR
jgi:hypothetical protein